MPIEMIHPKRREIAFKTFLAILKTLFNFGRKVFAMTSYGQRQHFSNPVIQGLTWSMALNALVLDQFKTRGAYLSAKEPYEKNDLRCCDLKVTRILKKIENQKGEVCIKSITLVGWLSTNVSNGCASIGNFIGGGTLVSSLILGLDHLIYHTSGSVHRIPEPVYVYCGLIGGFSSVICSAYISHVQTTPRSVASSVQLAQFLVSKLTTRKFNWSVKNVLRTLNLSFWTLAILFVKGVTGYYFFHSAEVQMAKLFGININDPTVMKVIDDLATVSIVPGTITQLFPTVTGIDEIFSGKKSLFPQMPVRKSHKLIMACIYLMMLYNQVSEEMSIFEFFTSFFRNKDHDTSHGMIWVGLVICILAQILSKYIWDDRPQSHDLACTLQPSLKYKEKVVYYFDEFSNEINENDYRPRDRTPAELEANTDLEEQAQMDIEEDKPSIFDSWCVKWRSNRQSKTQKEHLLNQTFVPMTKQEESTLNADPRTVPKKAFTYDMN